MPAQIAYPGVYLEETDQGRPIAGVPTSTAAFVGAAARGPIRIPTPVQSFADFERFFGALSARRPLGYAVMQFFDNGGRDALIVRTTSSTVEAALTALDNAAFSFLCLPPFQAGIDLPVGVRAAAAALCRRRRALFIVDPSHGWSSAGDAAGGLDAFFPQRGFESALYFPLLQVKDPLANGAPRTIVPCGAVAGLMAQTDTSRGLWKAPAGTGAALRGIVGPAIPLGDRDSELLNPLGINAVRTFPVYGTVVWGARTLARADRGESDYRYVSVRRLSSFIEESVSSGLRGLVFEPNTEATWARVRRSVTLFLDDLFRQGALAGGTAREAYFARCDSDTTTAADIAAGRANLEIGIAPLRPAEFLVLKLSLAMRGGVP